MTPQAASYSMMDAALLFHDPPAVADDAGIAPMSEWPGRRMREGDVVKAARDGYGRDWFRFWHRYNRFIEVWGEGGAFDRARDKMTEADYFRIFNWNQSLIFGDYGAGKSTKFVSRANHWAQRGIPSFHNGPYLGGWLVEGDEIFTLMQEMPKCSVLGHDEAHGTAPGRLANSTAVSVLRGLGANIRKLNVDWYLIGAQWKDVHPMILEECVEAIEMLKVPAQVHHQPAGHRVPPWDDPRHFLLFWQGWKDYPYRRMRERARERRESHSREDEQVIGFGPPDYQGYLGQEEARWAYVLTNTWRLVDLAAISSNRERVKERLNGTRDQSLGAGRNPYQAAVLEFAAAMREYQEQPGIAPPQWATAGDIASFTGGLEPAAIGKAASYFGVRNHRGKGYLVDELIDAWEKETGL